MPSVAIVKSDFHGHHSGSWSSEWLKICKDKEIPHELIDWRLDGAFDRLLKHDVILWHYSHYSAEEMKFAPGILVSLKKAGCVVFPDEAHSLHFDDKIVQSYLFSGLELPSPRNFPLHSLAAVENWLVHEGTFPVVAKLRAGSGASNVLLIQNSTELTRYARKMFSRGFDAQPNILFKIKSNASSSRSISQAISRLKRAPEFLFSLKQSSRQGRERGYVYLQEFIGGVDYDLKVVVIGDQLSFIGRHVRKGDFRASGGGDLFFDRKLITDELIDCAFRSADRLGTDCMGFDMICDPASGKPLILEASYGFSHSALMEAGGYYDRNREWHSVPLNAPDAVLSRLLAAVRK